MMLSLSNENSSVRAVHSVSDLCAKTRKVLEDKFAHLWVAGEVSQITTPASGHWYLSLKDDRAQMRCVMFKSANSRCSKPKIGDEVLVSGRFSLYEARGDLQLILDHLEPRGAGVLHKQFEELKKKLLGEGLFAVEHKKPLPKYPKHIALITSPSGAALKDILKVFERHNYAGKISIYPSLVQGEEAPKQLISAIEKADTNEDIELILLSRGGGSYEDLFCFNDESLARAIYSTKKPLVSAVGHEIDSTISDFVADIRSATPTAAAEQILTSYIKLISELDRLRTELDQGVLNQLRIRQSSLISLRPRLQSPIHKLQSYEQRLDNLQTIQGSLIERELRQRASQLDLSTERLKSRSILRLVADAENRLKESQTRLLRSGPEKIEQLVNRFEQTTRHLQAVSPMSILTRGYSVLLNSENRAIRSVAEIKTEEPLKALFSDGTANLKVIDTKKN